MSCSQITKQTASERLYLLGPRYWKITLKKGCSENLRRPTPNQ